MGSNQEIIENTIVRVSLAQQMIAEMVITGSNNILPCNDCPNATDKGCVKVSYVSPTGEKETGPFFEPEEKAVVCPIQKGVIYISNHNGHKSE